MAFFFFLLGEEGRLCYIDGFIAEPSKEDPKNSDWVSQSILIMSWFLNSMEVNVAASFKYSDTTKVL